MVLAAWIIFMVLQKIFQDSLLLHHLFHGSASLQRDSTQEERKNSRNQLRNWTPFKHICTLLWSCSLISMCFLRLSWVFPQSKAAFIFLYMHFQNSYSVGYFKDRKDIAKLNAGVLLCSSPHRDTHLTSPSESRRQTRVRMSHFMVLGFSSSRRLSRAHGSLQQGCDLHSLLLHPGNSLQRHYLLTPHFHITVHTQCQHFPYIYNFPYAYYSIHFVCVCLERERSI